MPTSSKPSFVQFTVSISLVAIAVMSIHCNSTVVAEDQRDVGQSIENVAFQSIDGANHKLGDFKTNNAIVVAMTSTSCPLSKKYLATLVELATAYKTKSIQFILVNPTASDKISDMQAAQAKLSNNAIYVHDKDGIFAAAVGATTTTDTLVINDARKIVYHGALDDQYGLNYSIDAPRKRYLVDALDAVLVGKAPAIVATAAPGCALDLTKNPNVTKQVTYHQQISRLVQKHCIDCHREGGVGPFSLETNEDIVSHAPMIQEVVQNGVMPPWFAAPQADGKPSPWANDRSMPTADKQELLSWLASERPIGDPQDAPAKRTFVTDWQIGKPDLVLQVPKPLSVKATGTMPYQMVTVESQLEEDKYVQAVEVRPSAREVVHHILVFVSEPFSLGKRGKKSEDTDDEADGFFAAYAPGYDALTFNEGYGKKLPKGAKLRFQIHYTPNGTATQDQPQIGFIFAEKKPEHLVDVAAVTNRRLGIPPGDNNFKVTASIQVPKDAKVLAFFPHMHLRGKAFKYEATFPDGKTETLLDIPRYDFNWQLCYRLSEPKTLPAGSKLTATAWYDNSEGNPANPDPKRTVPWGPQTYDEMMIGYVEYHIDGGTMGGGKLRDQITSRLSDLGGGRGIEVLFKQLDRDGDEKLSGDEIPEKLRSRLKAIDTDGDGSLTLAEAQKITQFMQRQ